MSKSNSMEPLKAATSGLAKALSDRAVSGLSDRVGQWSDRLEGLADGSGPIGQAVAKGGAAAASGESATGGALKGLVSGVKDKVTGGGKGGGGGGKATSSTNIIESIDVGVPVSVAYNQWTEFGAFPNMMKKVEKAEAEEDTKLAFKAQIFLSHRTWEATILEQVPDERIVWRSKGEKGHVDGAVTFHEVAPNLTRILVVLEYYPQGLFEKTGNLWRAQGRRARAELRHFRRHVMTRTILDPESVEGWRGVIEDGEVVKSHEDVVDEEEAAADEEAGDEEAGDEEAGDEEAGDEGGEESDEYAGEEPEDGEEPEEYADEEPAEDDGEAYEDEEAAPEGDGEDAEEYLEDEAEEPEDEEPEDDAEEYEEEPEEEGSDEYADEEDVEDDEGEPEEAPEDEAEPEDEPEPRKRRTRRRAG